MNTAQRQQGFFDNVSVYFDQAASFTEHPKGLLDQIKVCNSVYSFKFPVRSDKATRLFQAGARSTATTSCLSKEESDIPRMPTRMK